ncbi:MAG: tripartite tricarboxylate transporter permease [Oceanipulchritudo sp.]
MTAVSEVLTPTILMFMVMGVAIGILAGSLPGITDPMVLGLAIPFTFGMQPLPALLLLLGIHFGALYGGAITAILVNTPGTPASAATALDGYPLTRAGQPRKALQMSVLASFTGAIVSCIALITLTPLLATVALRFSPAEYFALGVFGLSVVAGVAGSSLSRGFFVATLGVFLSMIGTDPMSGTERFTFGIPQLIDGVNLIAALIGLFAISEVLNQFLHVGHSRQSLDKLNSGSPLNLREIRTSGWTMIKSGAIGSFIGSLPGTGAVISSFLCYNEAMRKSKTPERFGKGSLDGVAAASAGAKGTESAALIPLLTFGIPGDVGSAILLGAMILHGVRVGPELFMKSGTLVASLFFGIAILALVVLVLGWYGSRLFANVVKIPPSRLFPVILVLIGTGTYTLSNDMFNVWVAAGFGVLGFLMQKTGFPIPPLLLGLILGPIIEKNFLLAMAATGGDLPAVISRPLTLLILVFSGISLWFSVGIQKKIQNKKS